VRERPGEDAGYERGGLRDALDEADRQSRGPEHAHKVERQKSVDHLRRDVHEHGHEPERPNPAWNGAQPIGSHAGSRGYALLNWFKLAAAMCPSHTAVRQRATEIATFPPALSQS